VTLTFFSDCTIGIADLATNINTLAIVNP